MVLSALESAASNQSNTPAAISKEETPRFLSQKYLTSSALLPSQLANPDFRCNVILQFLIVASHLSAESPPLKNALSGFLLRARKILENDNPQLYEIVWNSILSKGREDQWRNWKKQKCSPAVFAAKHKKPSGNESPDRKKPRLSDGPLDGNAGGGGDDLSSEVAYQFLGLDEIRKSSIENRGKVPTLEQHLEPYVDALDPEAGIEDEYHPKNDSLFTWRAMRLYAKHQLPLLSQCRRPDDLERITRQWYQSQGKDIPGEMPTEIKDNTSDDEGKNDMENKPDHMGRKSDDDDVDMKDDGDSERDQTDDNVDEKSMDADRSIEDVEVNSQDRNFVDRDHQSQQSQSQPRSDDESAGNASMEHDEKFKDEQEENMEKDDENAKETMKEEQAAEEADQTEENPPIDSANNKDGMKEEKSKSEEPEAPPEDQEKNTPNVSPKVEPAASTEPTRQDSGKTIKEKFRPPPPRDTSAPRGGGGGRDNKPRSQSRGGPSSNRDDGSSSRRNRNDDGQQSRGRGGPPRGGGGGRPEDDYRGDSRQAGGNRGDRYGGGHRGAAAAAAPPAGSGPGRDDHQRTGRGNRDEYRSEGRRGGGNDGRPFRGGGGGGGGRRDRRRS
jgi:THO complex subunit 1